MLVVGFFLLVFSLPDALAQSGTGKKPPHSIERLPKPIERITPIDFNCRLKGSKKGPVWQAAVSSCRAIGIGQTEKQLDQVLQRFGPTLKIKVDRDIHLQTTQQLQDFLRQVTRVAGFPVGKTKITVVIRELQVVGASGDLTVSEILRQKPGPFTVELEGRIHHLEQIPLVGDPFPPADGLMGIFGFSSWESGRTSVIFDIVWMSETFSEIAAAFQGTRFDVRNPRGLANWMESQTPSYLGAKGLFELFAEYKRKNPNSKKVIFRSTAHLSVQDVIGGIGGDGGNDIPLGIFWRPGVSDVEYYGVPEAHLYAFRINPSRGEVRDPLFYGSVGPNRVYGATTSFVMGGVVKRSYVMDRRFSKPLWDVFNSVGKTRFGVTEVKLEKFVSGSDRLILRFPALRVR